MSLNVGPESPMKPRVPREHEEVVCVPPLSRVDPLLRANLTAAQSREYDVGGRSISRLAGDARRAMVALAREYTGGYRDIDARRADAFKQPIIATGHQPELFRPGVWLKNFVLGQTAARLGATAVNLIVDNDLCRNASIRVPGGTPRAPTTQSIPFDKSCDSTPFERRAIEDHECLRAFPRLAEAAMSGLVEPELLQAYWPRVVKASRRCSNLGLCLAQARHQQEAAWGLRTLELPLSTICDSEPFLWFAACLMARLREFHTVYNDALREFRRANRIRGRTRPVPDLADAGDAFELPFWLLPAGRTARVRLFVETKPGGLVISDGGEYRRTLNANSDSAVESIVAQLIDLGKQGVAIRPRALTTTMFVRLFLCDLFIHGIGGANYDRLTDELIRRLFAIEPPRFVTVSGTYLLELPREPVSAADLTRAIVQLRELEYHPERFIDPMNAGTEAGQLVAAKQRWIGEWPTVLDRKAAHDEVCRINAALRPIVANERRRCAAELHRLRTADRHQRILASREYAFCLHRAKPLREWLTGIG
jgi:hypothetical protein